MRGKGWLLLTVTVQNGITPAYAGKRSFALRSIHQQRDHPRVCGEKASTLVTFHPLIGSPPRLRGKAAMSSICPMMSRITPAYAGKSRY